MEKELLIATSNQNKFLEIADAIHLENLSIRSLKEFPGVAEAEEVGSDFAEIARNKARYYMQATGKPVLAEDSGLVIPSLNGFPGIYSARIAPDDAARIQLVLSRLKGFTEVKRDAYYICCMAFVMEDRLFESEGRCNGRITDSPMGSGGFGYDPVFIPEGLDLTFGMMELQEKMIYSHRGRAVRQMIPLLQSVFS